MSRQIQFHALQSDVRQFLDFVQGRDPVIVILRSSDSPDIKTVVDPSVETHIMTLWNQHLLSSLKREQIVYPGREYFGINASLPTLEFSPSEYCQWNGRPALLQGRLYGFFDKPSIDYEKWYNALARWIRKNFTKIPIPLPSGYIGPAAFDWFRKGGLLMPSLVPPVTKTWLSWVEAQDQHRALFAK